jgi:hypothetical protein
MSRSVNCRCRYLPWRHAVQRARGDRRVVPPAPALAAELLVSAFGVELPEHRELRVEPGQFTDVSPTQYRADAMVVLADPARVALAVVAGPVAVPGRAAGGLRRPGHRDVAQAADRAGAPGGAAGAVGAEPGPGAGGDGSGPGGTGHRSWRCSRRWPTVRTRDGPGCWMPWWGRSGPSIRSGSRCTLTLAGRTAGGGTALPGGSCEHQHL